jgi:hypothetical protein
MKKRAAHLGQKTSLDYSPLEPRQLLAMIVDGFDFGSSTTHIPQDTLHVVSSDLTAEPSITVHPEHGELIYDAIEQTLSYRPETGFTGSDTFQLEGSPQASTIRVWEPVFAVPDWSNVRTGQTASVDALSNDYSLSQQKATYFLSSNWGNQFQWLQDSTGFSIVDVSSNSGASVSISGNGQTVNFTPADGFVGTDIVTYTVQDENGNRSESTIAFDVTDQELSKGEFVSQAHLQQHQIENWMNRYASGILQSSYVTCGVNFLDDVQFARGPVMAFQASNSLSLDEATDIQEGDIVKSHGDLLYYVNHLESGEFTSTLSIVDVSDPNSPRMVSTTGFTSEIRDLYLSGDRVAVVLEGDRQNTFTLDQVFISVEPERFDVVVLDVTNTEALTEVYRTSIDGNYTDAKLIGDRLYVISQANDHGPTPRELENRQLVIDAVSPGDYIDAILASDEGFGVTITAQSNGQSETITVGHDQMVSRGNMYNSTLVTTLDLQDDSGIPVDIDLIESNHVDQIYVSTESIYLFDGSSVIKLDILEQGNGVEFTADGQLEGRLISQFSANESDGYLRVAVDDWTDGSSDIRVFEQIDDTLVLVSQLDDIAPGESIYSTRFEGDQVFVVTFRRIDPLFVIDLSDPNSPEILGELKIPGVSNYLQFIGDGLLLAVGRDANADTGQFGALQVSLFDVSDSTAPQLLDRYSFECGLSTSTPLIKSMWAGPTHQALTFDHSTNTLALPIFSASTWSQTESDHLFENQDSAISLFEVDRENGIQVAGQVDFETKALRTVIAGDNLVYLSADGLKTASRLSPTQVLGTLDLRNGETPQPVIHPVTSVDPVIPPIAVDPIEPPTIIVDLGKPEMVVDLDPSFSTVLFNPLAYGEALAVEEVHCCHWQDLDESISVREGLTGDEQANGITTSSQMEYGSDAVGGSELETETFDGFFEVFENVGFDWDLNLA